MLNYKSNENMMALRSRNMNPNSETKVQHHPGVLIGRSASIRRLAKQILQIGIGFRIETKCCPASDKAPLVLLQKILKPTPHCIWNLHQETLGSLHWRAQVHGAM